MERIKNKKAAPNRNSFFALINQKLLNENGFF